MFFSTPAEQMAWLISTFVSPLIAGVITYFLLKRKYASRLEDFRKYYFEFSFFMAVPIWFFGLILGCVLMWATRSSWADSPAWLLIFVYHIGLSAFTYFANLIHVKGEARA